MKEGFGKFGLNDTGEDFAKTAESKKGNKVAEEEGDPGFRAKKGSIPSINKTRNEELHYGSRTNY